MSPVKSNLIVSFSYIPEPPFYITDVERDEPDYEIDPLRRIPLNSEAKTLPERAYALYFPSVFRVVAMVFII